VIEGPLDTPGRLGPSTPAMANLVPDYSLLKRVDYDYYPRDAFFVRITKGCIRSCKFCAVPLLEKEFGTMSPLRAQVSEARKEHGERQHLVVMDNNILGITGFPMRFIPMNDVSRRHVAPGWKWRYLRGIQCILLATRGLVSPNPDFIRGAFDETFEEFLEILSMPDRYIIYRKHYANYGAADWKKMFRRLSSEQKRDLVHHLRELNANPRRRPEVLSRLERPFRLIMEHYYPGRHAAPEPEPNSVLHAASSGKS